MTLSYLDQEHLLNSPEAKKSGFSLLEGDIESRSIGGRQVLGKGQALNQLDKLIADWNSSHRDQQVRVNSGYRTKQEELDIIRRNPQFNYGEYSRQTGVTMHTTGQAFDISSGGSRVPSGFAQFAAQRGFFQTVSNDQVHFLYSGEGSGISAPSARFGFDSAVSRAISQASKEIGVDENVMRAFAHVESGGKTGLESHTGVKGLFQITGDTWKQVSGGQAYSTDPLAQSRVAAKLISTLSRRYGGDMDLVAVAYNAGDEVAKRAQTLISKGYDRDSAVREAAKSAVLDKKLFSDKIINDKFGGNRYEAAEKKANEVSSYRKRLASALEGRDYNIQSQQQTQRDFERSQTTQNEPSEKEDNIAQALFTEKFGICENSLSLLATKADLPDKAVAWLREKGLVNA